MNQVFRRLQLLFAQCLGLRVGADKVQVRALDGETLGNIDRVEPYGLSYRAKGGCEVYGVFPGGDRTFGLALIIGDKRYQMTLQEGEVGLHDDEGNWVHIKRGGIIEVKAGTKVIADTPLFETTHDAKIGGNLLVVGQTTSNQGYGGAAGGVAWMRNGAQVDGALINNGKNVGNTHTHAVPGSHTAGVD